MRTVRVLSLFAMVALVVALAGCSDDSRVLNGDNLTPDQQAIADLLDQLPEFQHDVVSHTAPDTGAALAAAVAEGWFWWREYTSVSRQATIDVTPGDLEQLHATADIQVTSTFTGLFHVVHRDTSGAFTHTTRTITDVYTQTGRFEQLEAATAPNRGWVWTQVSNIVGGTNPTSMTITTLNIDPLNSGDRMFSAENISTPYDVASRLMVDEAETINAWVQSGAGDNRVFRHDWASGTASREEMSNVDFGFYTDQYTAATPLTAAQAQRHAVIDVIAPGVIDGQATYDALIWAVPYGIRAGTPN